MSYIQLSKITPSVQRIALPGQINIQFTLSGTKDIPVELFYQLNQDNNIYFVTGNKNLVKELSLAFTHKGGAKSFNEIFSLVKVAATTPEEDFDYCFIYVEAVNKVNNMSDTKHCQIDFV